MLVAAWCCISTIVTSMANGAFQMPDAFGESFVGGSVSTAADAAAYSGLNAENAIEGKWRKKAYRLNYAQLGVNYGDNVEFQLRKELVILCPQTARWLYTKFTPLVSRYVRGSRPELEKIVARATEGCASDSDKALALMRYCRDLYDEKWYTDDFKQYVYGGTEEQLIAKGEILCECLGRLHVALCEIASIPGRIVMHVIGGHICSEVYVDGHWAYMDPRTGFYCRKPDGSIASVLELCCDPGLIDRQDDGVKSDISKWFTWPERAWKAREMYYVPGEVNGFENYSLADANRYAYEQKSYRQAETDGLFAINREYKEAIYAVFGLAGDGFRHAWGARPLHRIPIAYRNDGFSIFFNEPPMTRQTLCDRFIDPLKDSNAEILVWGLGPGSVFCYDTKVGEVFGAPLSKAQWALMRQGDRWVYENVKGLIDAGDDPLKVAVERGHENGLKVLARLEMNHEYGPAKDDNWLWVGLVGSLNKAHPECRISERSVLLDFKHEAVRAFKLAIFSEALEAGVDGLSLDFAVYPPFFAAPKAGTPIMTAFLREVRVLANRYAQKRGSPVEIMARVCARNAEELGCDWKTWMREGLVDYIVPTHYAPNETFDVNVDEFVSMGHRTGVRVYPTIWQALGFVSTDQMPDDEDTGRRRYDKPKTKAMYFAQAMLMHRAGVDGLQLGFSEDQWRTKPWLNDLADPTKVEFANKHYMVDVLPHCPVRFNATDAAVDAREKSVPLRIGDDVPRARELGHTVSTRLVLYAASLGQDQTLDVFVNGHGPAKARPTSADGAPIDPRATRDRSFIFDKEWWRRGELQVETGADWWQLGANEIRFRLTGADADESAPFFITWIDLFINYDSSDTPAG